MSENETNSEKENVNEDIEYTKEEIKDSEERTKILLNQANILFNRLENNIFSFKSRISSFFVILVASVAFLLALLQIIFKMAGQNLSITCFILGIIPYLILMIISAYLLLRLFWVTKYEEVDMFEDDRFEELALFNKQELLSDLLYYLKTSYLKNYKIHSKEISRFKVCITLFILGNVYILLYIFAIIIYKTKLVG